jgi:hypothetical protein
MDTCINTRVQSATCIFYTCPYGRVELLWPCVKNIRGHLFSIYNLSRCHQDTWLFGRVTTIIATVDTRRIEAFFVVP